MTNGIGLAYFAVVSECALFKQVVPQNKKNNFPPKTFDISTEVTECIRTIACSAGRQQRY